MFVQFVVVFLTSQIVYGEETPNLRGPEDKSLGLKSEIPAEAVNRPKSNEAFMNKIFDDLKSKLHSKEAKHTASQAELLANPQLTYGGFLVSRDRSSNGGNNNWNDCSGPVKSLVARSLACERYGESGSIQYSCYNSGPFIYVEMYEYSSHDCTGTFNYQTLNSQNSCSYGYGLQCIQHNSVPAFTEKGALVTYKFRQVDDCFNFASSYLGIETYRASDFPDSDDYYNYNYNQDFFDKCCFQYSIDKGCPFRLCGDGQIEPPQPEASRRLSNDASSAAAPASVKTVKWWETDDFKAKLTARASKKATAAGGAPVENASAITNKAYVATAATNVEKFVQSHEQEMAYNYRESGLVQIRNGVCSHEEKYDLWYKQTCHGGRQTITYTLFADDQCTRLIKRTEHNIWNAVPNFQACVMSANGNGRTSLTVCQDEVKLGKQVINDPPPMFLA